MLHYLTIKVVLLAARAARSFLASKGQRSRFLVPSAKRKEAER